MHKLASCRLRTQPQGTAFATAFRLAMADRFAKGSDARVERYSQLLRIINNWGSIPSMTPAFEWTIAALRATSRTE